MKNIHLKNIHLNMGLPKYYGTFENMKTFKEHTFGKCPDMNIWEMTSWIYFVIYIPDMFLICLSNMTNIFGKYNWHLGNIFEIYLKYIWETYLSNICFGNMSYLGNDAMNIFPKWHLKNIHLNIFIKIPNSYLSLLTKGKNIDWK